MLDYISIVQASEKWGIPKDAQKPSDARKKRMDMGGKNEK